MSSSSIGRRAPGGISRSPRGISPRTKSLEIADCISRSPPSTSCSSRGRTSAAASTRRRLMTDDRALLPFDEDDGRLIRRQWHDGRWFFSVVDVLGLLTDSERPRKYWSDLKAKLREEGFDELSAKIGQLKLRALDGKRYATDAADAETMLRIVQSIPSPKAEPVKQWLAKVGTEQLEGIAHSELLSG